MWNFKIGQCFGLTSGVSSAAGSAGDRQADSTHGHRRPNPEQFVETLLKCKVADGYYARRDSYFASRMVRRQMN